MLLPAKELLDIKQHNIGLYLGSFDPVHKAHIDIPLKIKDDYQLHHIIYVPTGVSPVGRKFRADYEDRVTMLKNATKEYDFFSVSDFENSSKKTAYSINTIHHFEEKHKTSFIRLIMGEDNFIDFTNWYKYEEILLCTNIIVLSRDNLNSYGNIPILTDYIEKDIKLFNKSRSGKIHFASKFKSDLSASLIRDLINHKKSIKNYVTDENYEYIENKGLYK